VARIPTAACLTCGDCTHSASVLELQRSLGEREWLATLGFALMLERCEDDVVTAVAAAGGERAVPSSSPWAPYLAVLPAQEPNVVLLWSDEQRRHLAGTDVEQALRDERAAARAEWDKHVGPAVAQLKGAGAACAGGCTFDKYLASRSVVSSRAFTINPAVGVGLVPIADLFNHRTGGHHVHLTDLDDTPTQATQQSLRDSPLAMDGDARDGENQFMCIKVVQPVDEGDEVLNTYGELGNAKLLCSYGFAQSDNPADQITIGVPALRAAAAMCGVSGAQITARLAWCEISGVCDDESTFHLSVRAVPSDALLLVLWTLATTDVRFDALRQATVACDEGTSLSSVKAETLACFVSIAESQEGGLKEESGLRILSETLRRRRAMYAAVPDAWYDSEISGAWKSSISILLSSEKQIILTCEKYLKERMGSDEGTGQNRKRKVDDDNVSEPEASIDVFSLFD